MEHLSFIFIFQNSVVNVSLFEGGGGFILIVTSFFRGVILFVTECDTGGGRGSKNGHFCVTSFMNAP